MPYKDPAVRKAYHKAKSRKHYEANREELINKQLEIKQQLRKDWNAFKSTLACTQCGFDHPAALDFHHEDPSKKDGNVHRYISNGQPKKAFEEIEKCIVLCANCHRIHHYKEKTDKLLINDTTIRG